MQFQENAAGGLTLTRYDWLNELIVEIPEEMNGKKVTEIGKEAFMYCYADEIKLPGSLVKIADNAFAGCAYLKSVTIPASCREIGEKAFAGCEQLAAIDIPSTLYKIGKDAFAETAYLSSSSQNMIMLGDGILYAYTGSESAVTVPDGVKVIGAYAFAGKTEITEISIPASVKSVQEGAFSGCTALRSVTAAGSLEEVGANAFADTAWLNAGSDYVTLGGCLIAYRGSESVINMPDSIHSIGGGAFAGNADITTLNLTDAVTMIGSSAFEGCTSLQIAKLGEQVKRIDSRAFFGCKTLHYLRFGHALTEVGEQAFVSCPALAEVYLPDSTQTIGEKAFGYQYNPENEQFSRQAEGLTLYANAAAVNEYARNESIKHEPLPQTENTEPAPEVTTVAAAESRLGKVSGTAWLYAAVVGGVLLVAGLIGAAFRKKKH